MILFDIVIGSLLFVSVVGNVILVGYARSTLAKINTVYRASEETSEIFSMIDAFREHLNGVYEMPTFYGDETLKGLLEHSKQMIEHLKKYENIYSFTQPDLEEQLSKASADLENHEEEEKTEE
tara:strand:- start:340 stop:708 length:369 start_codon:yes stop_codon:yes gene_type:complete